jgi:ribosomal protein S18 acetylase RimI-like enzyme
MIVHPDYQGRGIGTRLLAEICCLADKAGQDVYLDASPAGTKLYLNAGFEKVGEIDIQDGRYVLACMLRKAGSKV